MRKGLLNLTIAAAVVTGSAAAAAAHDIANTKGLTPKNHALAARPLGASDAVLAQKVDALLRGELRPGTQTALADRAGTTELFVGAAPEGRTVRLTDLRTHALIAQWRLTAAAKPQELRAVSDAVFALMALPPARHIDAKPALGPKSRRH